MMPSMYRMLHDELSHVAEIVRLRQALRAQHEAVAARLDVESRRHRRLAARLRAERKDVARLEGLSFKRLFAVLDGELESRLAEEQAEATTAELRFVEQDQRVAALRAELDGLDRRIAELGDVDTLYREALEAKGRMLVERDDEHGRMVLALAEQHSEACAKHRELREAIDCGGELARVLADAAKAIDEAETIESWGLRGREWSRNSYLADASHEISAALAIFERFRKELSDIDGMALHEGDEGDDDDDEHGGWLSGFSVMMISGTIEKLARDVATLRDEVRLRIEQLTALEAANLEHRRECRKRLEDIIHAG
jgi:hypothetical protein